MLRPRLAKRSRVLDATRDFLARSAALLRRGTPGSPGLRTASCRFLYCDGVSYLFMGSSFEQFALGLDGREDRRPYLREGQEYLVEFWDGLPVDVRIPPRMVFIVEQAENYAKPGMGQTFTRRVVTETGLSVRVPCYVKQGERIVVDTASGEYVERVSE